MGETPAPKCVHGDFVSMALNRSRGGDGGYDSSDLYMVWLEAAGEMAAEKISCTLGLGRRRSQGERLPPRCHTWTAVSVRVTFRHACAGTKDVSR